MSSCPCFAYQTWKYPFLYEHNSFIWQVKICPREKYIYKQICIKLLFTVFHNTIKAATVCHYVTNETLHFILLAPNP